MFGGVGILCVKRKDYFFFVHKTKARILNFPEYRIFENYLPNYKIMRRHYFTGIVFPRIAEAEEPGYNLTFLNKNQKQKFCDAYAELRKRGQSTPVVYEHEDEQILGDIVSYYMDRNENLCVVGRLNNAEYANSLKSKNGKVGLSLKMDHLKVPVMDGSEVARYGIKEKDLIHVGIVEVPAFDGSLVDTITDDPNIIAESFKKGVESGYYVNEYDRQQLFGSSTNLDAEVQAPTDSQVIDRR